MRAVRSKDTGPELQVRSIVHRLGYRFRLHRAELAGKPDLVLPRLRKVIFVHGCFWHGHDCKRVAREPMSNRDYWSEKIRTNKLRDCANIASLNSQGWDCLVVWECELKDPDSIESVIQQFLQTRGADNGSSMRP